MKLFVIICMLLLLSINPFLKGTAAGDTISEEQITFTNLQGQHKKSSPLVPSGLLGPVYLEKENYE